MASSASLVRKQGGHTEPFCKDKVLRRLQNCSSGCEAADPETLLGKVLSALPQEISSSDLDELLIETCAYQQPSHPDYFDLAGRLVATKIWKMTPKSFSEFVREAFNFRDVHGRPCPLVSPGVLRTVQSFGERIDKAIVHERDLLFDFFGIKTLERAYLLRINRKVRERPQYLWMRVALGLHCDSGDLQEGVPPSEEAVEEALRVYHQLSEKLYIHGTPTLFHAGTTRPRLASCFLMRLQEDSVGGIFNTVARAAKISAAGGGLGVSLAEVRAAGSPIHSTGSAGQAKGLISLLRIFNATSRYVDQGGNKRKGAFSVYIEPWHPEIFDFLDLRKNAGVEDRRARDLFTGLWVPDLFMRRVRDGDVWSLFCPDACRDLVQLYGPDFDRAYEEYERRAVFLRQVPARDVWKAVVFSQIETGTPYMLFKDACNQKSNQKGLGTICCSNLCTEIVQFTAPDEVAVCNLASVSLPMFLRAEAYTRVCDTPTHQIPYFDEGCPSNVSSVRPQALSSCSANEKDQVGGEGSVAEQTEEIKRQKEALQTGGFAGGQMGEEREVSSPPPSRSPTEGGTRGSGGVAGSHQRVRRRVGDDREGGEGAQGQGPLLDCTEGASPSQQLHTPPPRGCIPSERPAFSVSESPPVSPVHFPSSSSSVPSSPAVLLNGEPQMMRGAVSRSDPTERTPLCRSSGSIGSIKEEGKKEKRKSPSPLLTATPGGEGRSHDSICRFDDALTISPISDPSSPSRSSRPSSMRASPPIFERQPLPLQGEGGEREKEREKDVWYWAHASLESDEEIGEFEEWLSSVFDFEKLRQIVRQIVRNLNRTIDVGWYPLPEARKSNEEHRPIGIGVQGLADVFAVLRLPFECTAARVTNARIFEQLHFASLEASADLARSEGTYRSFTGSPASDGKFQFDLWGDFPPPGTPVETLKCDSGTQPFPPFLFARSSELRLDWQGLRERVRKDGLRNSLLVAPMPTASTAQIFGNCESFEPLTTNVYRRSVLAGEYLVLNPHLVRDLCALGKWDRGLQQKLVARGGSVQRLDIPAELKALYRTVWEISQRALIDLAADRGPFVCQSQSMNLYLKHPTLAQVSSMLFYSWGRGLKTGIYYLRSRPSRDAVQVTVDPRVAREEEGGGGEGEGEASSSSASASGSVTCSRRRLPSREEGGRDLFEPCEACSA